MLTTLRRRNVKAQEKFCEWARNAKKAFYIFVTLFLLIHFLRSCHCGVFEHIQFTMSNTRRLTVVTSFPVDMMVVRRNIMSACHFSCH